LPRRAGLGGLKKRGGAKKKNGRIKRPSFQGEGEGRGETAMRMLLEKKRGGDAQKGVKRRVLGGGREDRSQGKGGGAPPAEGRKRGAVTRSSRPGHRQRSKAR